MALNEKVSNICENIFANAIDNYHLKSEIDQPITNPYPVNTLEYLLHAKCWIDIVQWHMEDEVRDPYIDAAIGLMWKRNIDLSNQKRTDVVENIDDFFQTQYANVKIKMNARINTESPAWVIDRLSILYLKIYHMREETIRPGTTKQHISNCTGKLNILLNQKADLSNSLDELLNDIEGGRKVMKTYKQMKMYNDENLNPILYQNK